MCVVSSGYGVEHAQCVPPSEYSEPGFITESYQTLHPISSEELLTLKYESEYPAVILRDTPLNPLQGDYFSVKQEVVSPDNMCVGRLSRGKEPHIRHRIISERVIKRSVWTNPPVLACMRKFVWVPACMQSCRNRRRPCHAITACMY